MLESRSDSLNKLKKTMQRKNSIVRVRDQANDQARRLHSEGGAAKIIKIAVQRKESIQGSSDPASLVHHGGEKT